jgi:hypothetical protein
LYSSLLANAPALEDGKAHGWADRELIEPDYSFSARLQVCVSNAFFISVSASSSIECVDLGRELWETHATWDFCSTENFFDA